MKRHGILAVAFLGIASLGTPCGGPHPAVVLWPDWPESPIAHPNVPFWINVESRDYRQGEAFAFKVTYPSSSLTLVSTDLAHGGGDLDIAPSPQTPGSVVIYAANAVANYSTAEPGQGVILARLQFVASSVGSPQLTIASAKLATSFAANPVTLTSQPNPVLGAPVTIQVVSP